MLQVNRWFAALVFATASPPAGASMPVSFTVIGCVVQGQFVSEGYTFKVEDNRTGKTETADLAHYQGTTLRIVGMLSPGDRLIGSYFVIDESCKPELQMSKFD